MVLVGRVSFQHAVLSDQAAGAFGQKDLVAELDGFLSLAPLDQRLVLIDEAGDLLEEGVECDVLGEIGEAPLGRSGSGHGESPEAFP